MRTWISTLVGICIVASASWTTALQDARSESSNCAMVQQALSAAQQLKIGMTRREVEKYFERDGGLQFPDTTHHVYPRCNLIKLDVDYTSATADHPFSPDDKVAKVSKPFLAYPARD